MIFLQMLCVILMLCFCLYLLSFIKEKTGQWIFVVLLFLFAFYAILNVLMTTKETYKKALEHNPYEKVYRYEQTDSGFVKVDSVYIKK